MVVVVFYHLVLFYHYHCYIDFGVDDFDIVDPDNIVYGNEVDALHSLMQRISFRDKEVIKASIEASFMAGWEASNTSVSRKAGHKELARNQYVEKQVLSKFMEDGKLIAPVKNN